MKNYSVIILFCFFFADLCYFISYLIQLLSMTIIKILNILLIELYNHTINKTLKNITNNKPKQYEYLSLEHQQKSKKFLEEIIYITKHFKTVFFFCP